jgi:hypothetical protein
VRPVHKVVRVLLGPLVHKDHKALLVLPERPVLWDQLEPQARRVRRASPAQRVQRVHKDSRVRRVLLVQLGPLDQLDPLELLVPRDLQESLALQARSDLKGLRGSLEPQDHRVRKVVLALPVRLEPLGRKVQLDPRARRDNKGLPESREQPGLRVLWDQRAQLAHKDLRASPEQPDPKGLRVPPGLPVQLVRSVRKDRLESPVPLDLRVRLAPQVRRDLRAVLVLLVRQDLKALWDRPAPRVRLDQLEPPVRLVRRVLPG